jgi:predicted Abi (CAAX) family protease
METTDSTNRAGVRPLAYYADDANKNLYVGLIGQLPTSLPDGIGL